jgi:hypothetical protein
VIGYQRVRVIVVDGREEVLLVLLENFFFGHGYTSNQSNSRRGDICWGYFTCFGETEETPTTETRNHGESSYRGYTRMNADGKVSVADTRRKTLAQITHIVLIEAAKYQTLSSRAQSLRLRSR